MPFCYVIEWNLAGFSKRCLQYHPLCGFIFYGNYKHGRTNPVNRVGFQSFKNFILFYFIYFWLWWWLRSMGHDHWNLNPKWMMWAEGTWSMYLSHIAWCTVSEVWFILFDNMWIGFAWMVVPFAEDNVNSCLG